MEDSFTETESSRLLQLPPTPQEERENHNEEKKTKQADGGGGGGGGGGETATNGLLKWLAASSSSSSEITNKEDDEKPGLILEQEKEEAKRSGLLDLLVSPRGSNSKPIDIEVFQVDETTHDNNDLGGGAAADGDESGGAGGGVISNLMSDVLFHQNAGEGVSGQGMKEGIGAEVVDIVEEKEGGDSSFTENILSHFPPIPENVAPESDEASILIHSVVHD